MVVVMEWDFVVGCTENLPVKGFNVILGCLFPPTNSNSAIFHHYLSVYEDFT